MEKKTPQVKKTQPPDELKPHNRWVRWILIISGYSLLLIYVIIPIILKIFPGILAEIIFLNRVAWPPSSRLSQPELFGLNATRNFKISSSDGVRVGAWHVLPASVQKVEETEEFYTKQLASGKPIILYLHGNAGNRGGSYRVEFYKIFSEMDYHVIAIDYRGYGESNGWPSEEGVTSDTIAAYRWIKSHSANSPVYMWAHSLGTGIAVKAARLLSNQNEAPTGLFLSSPFNNIFDCATYHPISFILRMTPCFTWSVIEGLKENHIYFSSDESISYVNCPIFILHAEDDTTIPIHLATLLYQAAFASRPLGSVRMHTFPASLGLGHKFTHRAPNIKKLIREFIEERK